MDQSPYTPGAGHTPPVLAGRDGLLRDWQLVLNDIVAGGRVRAQDMILAGPRGVGKTVTVSAFARLAKDQGFEVVNLQAVSGHTGLVEALLQRARTRLAEEARPWQRAEGLRARRWSQPQRRGLRRRDLHPPTGSGSAGPGCRDPRRRPRWRP